MTDSDALQQSGLSQAEVDRFQQDGFLLVEHFFTEDELETYGKAVDAAVAYRSSDDHRKMQEKNLYEQTFVQCMRLWEDRPDVSPFTFHPKLCAAAAALSSCSLSPSAARLLPPSALCVAVAAGALLDESATVSCSACGRAVFGQSRASKSHDSTAISCVHDAKRA